MFAQVYTEFTTHVDSICFFLRSDLWRATTAAVVDSLQGAARTTTDRLQAHIVSQVRASPPCSVVLSCTYTRHLVTVTCSCSYRCRASSSRTKSCRCGMRESCCCRSRPCCKAWKLRTSSYLSTSLPRAPSVPHSPCNHAVWLRRYQASVQTSMEGVGQQLRQESASVLDMLGKLQMYTQAILDLHGLLTGT